MLGSSILDVAIGMAFIYLLLSLIATALQEVLASLVQARSANLERGIRSLFSGDSLNDGANLFQSIYNHGLVRGLYQDPSTDYGPGNPEPKWTLRWRKLFGEIRLTLRWLLHMSPPGKPRDVDDLLLPSYIPARTFALALRDILNDPKPHGWDSLKNIETNLTDLSAKYADNKAVEALLALVIDAAGKPEKFQANIENWYNDSMDRVSGWYRRYVQNILLFIGLAIAIAFNVDSIRVARTLWVDKDARAGLTSAASEYLKKHPDPPMAMAASDATSQTTPTSDNKGLATQSTKDKPAAANAKDKPAIQTAKDKPADPSVIDKPADQKEKSIAADKDGLQKQLENTVSAFNDVSKKSLLPIGWRYSLADYYAFVSWDHALTMLEVLAGWIITAIALSLGAPFWFDALNKFMVVRGTIKPQEKSRTDNSKDG